MRQPSKRGWPKVAAVVLEGAVSGAAEVLEGVISFVRGRSDWSIDLLNRTRLIGCRDRLAGVIGLGLDAELPAIIRRRRLPLVNILTEIPVAAVNVLPRDDLIGEIGARHLLSCGLARVLYFGHDRPFSHARARGFARVAGKSDRRPSASDRKNDPICVVLPWTYRRPLYQRTIARFLRTLRPPMGIMAWNDDTARTIVEACLTQGLRVPEDFAVLGVDNDTRFTELRKPTISSIDVDRRTMGFEAMANLDRIVGTGGAAGRGPTTVWVKPAAVVPRASTDLVHVDDALVARSIRWIRERAATPISPRDVVEAADVSRSLLSARFRAALGRSIGDEIREARLTRARALLADPDVPLLEVATQSGFADLPHLCNVFRRGTGTTPGRYRASAVRDRTPSSMTR